MENPVRLIPYAIIGLFVLSLLLFLVALQQLHRGRTGPYWRLRRNAGQRGGQLFLVSVALFGTALAVAFFTGFAAIALGDIDRFFRQQRGPDDLYGVVVPTFTPSALAEETDTSPTPTQEPSPTQTPTLTTTPPPSQSPIPTLTPTLTPTPPPSLTPSPTFESLLNLNAPQPLREPDEDAEVQIIAADYQISANGTPVNSQTIFQSGVKRIYLFISYRNMDDGVAWSRVLYRDGIAVQGGTVLWTLGDEGASYFFFGNEEGYSPGSYEVRLGLNDREVNVFSFSIVP